jgi:hypothetical protein
MGKDGPSAGEEVKPPVCELPLVNVFRHYKVDSGKGCRTHGSVEPVMDKIIGKKVFRIVGHVLAANYLRVPSLSNQTLGLHRRYLYAQIRTIPDKYFVLHVYVGAKDDTVLDLSITNLFNTIKLLGNVLQYPCEVSAKWTTVCIDLVEVPPTLTNSSPPQQRPPVRGRRFHRHDSRWRCLGVTPWCCGVGGRDAHWCFSDGGCDPDR